MPDEFKPGTLGCPELQDLPHPPAGRRGWPWTESTPAAPDTLPDGRAWPRITVITPSFNQGAYVEENIRSVLLQGYPNLEFMVMDGGSSDQSRDIIVKYSPWIPFWVSEPDAGQSSAINKALRRSTGEVFNWINSDDTLLPGALRAIAESYVRHPDSLLTGNVVYRDEESNSRTTMLHKRVDLAAMVEFWHNAAEFHQPGIFVPLRLVREAGLLDETLHFAFDYEFYCRLLLRTDSVDTGCALATYRIHPAAKSVAQKQRFLSEVLASSRRYWNSGRPLRFPRHDNRGAGLLLQVGLWNIFHREAGGIELVKEALRTDFRGALLSTALFFPGWLRRTLSRTVAKASPGRIEASRGPDGGGA